MHSILAFEMPELAFVLRRRQMLERKKVTQREQETPQMDCRAPRSTVRQMTTFRHFFEAFYLFITSDQTYPLSGSRSSVAAIAMEDESVNKRDNRCPMRTLSATVSEAYTQRCEVAGTRGRCDWRVQRLRH